MMSIQEAAKRTMADFKKLLKKLAKISEKEQKLLDEIMRYKEEKENATKK